MTRELESKNLSRDELVALESLEEPLQSKLYQLNEMTTHLSILLDTMNQGLLFINQHGIITTYNAAAVILLGLEEQDVLYQPVDTHFADEYFGFSMQEALKKRVFPPLQTKKFRSFLGIDRTMEVQPTFVEHPKESQGLLLLLRDITEFERLQQEVKRTERLKALGEMAAHLAHELRNPLSSIKGFCSLLYQDLEGDDDKRETVQKIFEGLNVLNTLLTHTLDFSRPLAAYLQPTDLVDLLQHLIEQVKQDQRVQGKIHVEFLTSLSACKVSLDPFLVTQALWNLLINAIQAMPEGGDLTLSLMQKGKEVTIGIFDTGCGIDKELHTSLFQPFFTTKSDGNGFGLSEVHKIMEAHQGKVTFSSSPQEGSHFSLIFYQGTQPCQQNAF